MENSFIRIVLKALDKQHKMRQKYIENLMRFTRMHVNVLSIIVTLEMMVRFFQFVHKSTCEI